MKKIGILGSGIVGRTLAAGFDKKGYAVTIGTRYPEKLDDWRQDNPDVEVSSVEEAAAFGEIIVLAVKGSAAAIALNSAGEKNLTGKIVIDTTNPIGDEEPVNGVLPFFSQMDKSLMEDLQEAHPHIRLVKAFNSIGAAYMVDPIFEMTPTMFTCGIDPAAKSEVHHILHEFGWEVADMGGIEAARAIEPLCMLWCIPGLRENKWQHAFKLMKAGD